MIHPSIHLNGTSKEELARQIEQALTDLNRALGSLEQAAPNARDYYPQGDGAFKQARAEHTGRVGKLCEVREDLETLYEALV